MITSFNEISGSNNWSILKQINKGWSNDKKYYIKTVDKKELLLRVSKISEYENKKKEFESLKHLTNMDILMSWPIDFGTCNEGQLVYSLLTWINGEDAEIILPKLSNEEQYSLGIKAGQYLMQIHKIPAPEKLSSWEERFNRKIDIKIANYKACSIHLHGADRMIKYIEDNRILLQNRPQSFQHGDYHVGNMIITPEGELAIIDFNRMDYGDPWEEFNRIVFCANISPAFATGYINGYFHNEVPDSFFRLMALYIGTNQLSAIPWAIPFGEAEINTMLKQAQNVLKWYDDFKTYIPNWYITNHKSIL
ncbi:Predicted kinase, aminoglycoside phosphotransferase (APT) family [Proteiniborus ethanoligenes]|uniref:Predicted kinase, aminoglycoside phosphotransferase (APT) family n=1 Tax=Proteiniborus ethanoligenes TaxID=415015 RepID=A0A1H3ME79_9FIRM|nr:phosphotransferase family protein [Proteiniborus ethanoligenes]SDY74499.1 Predicted kinase, aminoglycoside phosphotransferase (APT) family [Proteiniborus ethanoligenes]